MRLVRRLILVILKRFKLSRVHPESKIVHAYETWKFQRDYFVDLLNIDLAIDAGANLGQWAVEFRRLSSAVIVSFEPDVRCKVALDNLSHLDSKWIVNYVALGHENKFEDLNLWDVEGGSTSLKDISQFGEVFTSWSNEMTAKKKIEVKRLDSYLSELDMKSQNALLKIDVQGYEKEVLLGSSGVIEKFQLIEIELPLVEIYAGSSKAGELICHIEELGFDLVCLATERWASPGAADCDALFIKRETYKEIKERNFRNVFLN